MLIKRLLSYCLCFVGLCMTALPTPIQASKNIDPAVSKSLNSKQVFNMSTSSAKKKPKPTKIKEIKPFHNIYKSFPIKLADGKTLYNKYSQFSSSVGIESADHKFLEEYVISNGGRCIEYNYYKINKKKFETVYDILYSLVILPEKIIYENYESNFEGKFNYEYKNKTLTVSSKYIGTKISYTNNNGEITGNIIDQGNDTSNETETVLKPSIKKIMFIVDNFEKNIYKKIIDVFIIPK